MLFRSSLRARRQVQRFPGLDRDFFSRQAHIALFGPAQWTEEFTRVTPKVIRFRMVVATGVVQAANDKQQLQPMLNKVTALPAELLAWEEGRAEPNPVTSAYLRAISSDADAIHRALQAGPRPSAQRRPSLYLAPSLQFPWSNILSEREGGDEPSRQLRVARLLARSASSSCGGC